MSPPVEASSQDGGIYLLWQAHEHVEFRLSELESVISLFNADIKFLEKPSEEPFYLIQAPNADIVKKVVSRCVLVRSAFELWAQGHTKEIFFKNLKSLSKTFLSPYSAEDQSFRIRVESFGKKLTRELKIEKIEELDFLPLDGPIRLESPDHSFHLLEYYGLNRNKVPDNPLRSFFGRWICDGHRRAINSINLRERSFIGNTSMDPTLSLIMANMAKAQAGQLVLDPFVGSGSLLVAAAHFGCYVMGTDIDYLMLHGKAKPTRCNHKTRSPGESIYLNFQQYGLASQYIDVLVADASLPIWSHRACFDAIITDPPYGIRESTEKIGTKKTYTIPENLAAAHIPSKIEYNLQQILLDLLNFSANHLKKDGRLVYWLPAMKEDFSLDVIPKHPCLRLITYSEQSLKQHTSRYLIVMEKTRHPTSSDDKSCLPVSNASEIFRLKYFKNYNNK